MIIDVIPFKWWGAQAYLVKGDVSPVDAVDAVRAFHPEFEIKGVQVTKRWRMWPGQWSKIIAPNQSQSIRGTFLARLVW